MYGKIRQVNADSTPTHQLVNYLQVIITIAPLIISNLPQSNIFLKKYDDMNKM